MGISYDKLWKIINERNLNKYYLRKNGINPKVVDALSKNKNVNMSTIIDLCKLLNCQPGDILQYVPDDQIENDAKKFDNK